MKKAIAAVLEKHYICLTRLYMGLIAIVIFLTGVGRYRSILFLAVFFTIYALLLTAKKNTSSFKSLYVPVFVVALYFDIKNGPILPVLKFNNLIVAFVGYFGFKWLLDRIYKQSIEKITDQAIFTCCPMCNFEYNEFTKECKNCGYISGISSEQQTQQNYVEPKSQEYLLNDVEEVKRKISLGFFSDASIYKNDTMLDCNEIIVTNYRVILISKQSLHRGITNKSEIILSNIIDAHIEEKEHHGLNMNMIVFKENENIYELFQIHKRSPQELAPIVELLRPKQ